jgi:hypothetical protein
MSFKPFGILADFWPFFWITNNKLCIFYFVYLLKLEESRILTFSLCGNLFTRLRNHITTVATTE